MTNEKRHTQALNFLTGVLVDHSLPLEDRIEAAGLILEGTKPSAPWVNTGPK